MAMQPLSCGGCGTREHTLASGTQCLIATCVKCKSQTVIKVRYSIELDWPSLAGYDELEDGAGVLAPFTTSKK